MADTKTTINSLKGSENFSEWKLWINAFLEIKGLDHCLYREAINEDLDLVLPLVEEDIDEKGYKRPTLREEKRAISYIVTLYGKEPLIHIKAYCRNH